MNKRPLRRGVYLPPCGPFGDPQVLVDLAVRAEAAGWEGVFVWDHVVRGAASIADCWTSLGATAVATRTIRIGATVTPLPRRRPWIVAVDLTAMAEAGATWWMESLGDWDPLEQSLQVVDAGPPG